MRNANTQREDSMIRVSASQQPSKPHVSHAEIGGRLMCRMLSSIVMWSGRENKQQAMPVTARFPVRKFHRSRAAENFRTAGPCRKITTASAAPC
jgi:hypothetical protein